MLCHVFWSQVEYKIVCFIYYYYLFVLSNNVCKNACKMPSFVLFPFTDKINEPNISEVFVLSLSVCFELKVQMT